MWSLRYWSFYGNYTLETPGFASNLDGWGLAEVTSDAYSSLLVYKYLWTSGLVINGLGLKIFLFSISHFTISVSSFTLASSLFLIHLTSCRICSSALCAKSFKSLTSSQRGASPACWASSMSKKMASHLSISPSRSYRSFLRSWRTFLSWTSKTFFVTSHSLRIPLMTDAAYFYIYWSFTC